MTNQTPHSRAQYNRQIEHWNRQLYNQVPLVGALVRRSAANELAAAARGHATLAAQYLALAVARVPDPKVVALALNTLGALNDLPAIDCIWRAWDATRHPSLEALLKVKGMPAREPANLAVLSAIALDKPEAFLPLGAEIIPGLLQACQDRDALIRKKARAVLPRLSTPGAIDALCEHWRAKRESFIEKAIREAGLIASQPPAARVLTALLNQRSAIIQGCGPQEVPALLEACADGDAILAQRARELIHQLKRPESQDALCELFIEQGSSLAGDICLKAGYVPTEVTRKALFFFLSGQMARYEAVDFDQRILHAVYAAGSERLRQHIARRLQTSGRADLLTVIAGEDFRSRAAEMTDAEAGMLTQMLAESGNLERLWTLALELPFRWSAHLIARLAQAGWQPADPEQAALFARLAGLTAPYSFEPSANPALDLPPAVQKALMRVVGRINSVAFAPNTTQIAIGTGSRRLVSWDYHSACVRHALNGFAHSIGKVAYTGSGILLAGERANDQAPCALTAWEEDRGIVLGQHAGAVTAIAGLGADCALTAGRDARVVLWDVKARKPIADARVDDWARGLQVSPDGDRAALLGANLRMVRLPELRAIHTLVISPNSIAACAAFAPPENRLLAGLRNGKVLLSPLDQPNGRPVLLTEHAGMLRYAGYLRAQRRYLTAGSERVLRFFDAQSLAQTGELRLGGERLTSLTVSPDERLMAVGDSDACMSLWDLRPLDVPAIAGRPFAAARPADLGALACLDGALHGQTAAVIDYLRAVLQYRFRYDVQIDDASLIRPGEFDIMVE